MQLMDLVGRRLPPVPWADGEKIPWHEPAFSARMLTEHLSQAHDLASRREPTIAEHVAWIHGTVLGEAPTRILDIGCGPGCYASRLAELGHACTGVDISPASIEYAKSVAAADSLDCRYVLGDVRDAELGTGYGLAMFLFGEINVFRREHAVTLLARARDALEPGGQLLLEPHTYAGVESAGRAAPRFSTHEHGLFSDAPYLQLEETAWDVATETATTRWWIIDARTGAVDRHAQTVQAYDESGYRHVLADAGFEEICLHPSLTGGSRTGEDGLFAITAQSRIKAGRTRSR